jgi:chemotaxis protein MotB
VTRITDEGLVIEIYDLENIPLFEGSSDAPRQILRDIAALIAQAARSVTNDIAIGGHVRANPLVMLQNPVWELSAARATTMRELLEGVDIPPNRVQRVTGHADRTQIASDPMSPRNNRLEVILLRDVPRN